MAFSFVQEERIFVSFEISPVLRIAIFPWWTTKMQSCWNKNFKNLSLVYYLKNGHLIFLNFYIRFYYRKVIELAHSKKWVWRLEVLIASQQHGHKISLGVYFWAFSFSFVLLLTSSVETWIFFPMFDFFVFLISVFTSILRSIRDFPRRRPVLNDAAKFAQT